MSHRLNLLVAFAAGQLALATVVVDTPPARAAGKTQQVKVKMTDIKYSVKTLRLKKGVGVEFSFTNNGKVVHEAVFGTHAEQIAHDKEMASMGGMAMGDEENAISMKPGATKRITHTFDNAGTYEIGCHTPGHYAAGMTIKAIVS